MLSGPLLRCARVIAHQKSKSLQKALNPPMGALSRSLPSERLFSTTTVSGDLLLRNDEKRTGITTLTLNNPSKYNVLSWEMLSALQDQLDDISNDPSVRVLVVGAAGKAFCSGHDLKEMQSHDDTEETKTLFAKCSQVMISLNRLPQPVIAKVQGVATAAGCQLVASCDLAIGSSDARLGVSGITVGLFCSTPAVALSRVIQRKHAMHMLLTGEIISAEKALSYGLLNAVVPPNLLEAETMDLAQKIASKSSFGIQLGKEMFYNQLTCDSLEDAYEYASDKMACNLHHPDAKQGIESFFRKNRG
ncbi:hypothetical protein ACHAWF_004924 [Thalassiosira exigua]